MSDVVRSVQIVSDGILVEFGSGVHCYYPASFLLEHRLDGANQIFLAYDPSSRLESESIGVLSVADQRNGLRLMSRGDRA